MSSGKGIQCTYLGITGTELCPVAAIVNYLVLPRVNAKTTAVFGFSDGQPLTRTRFVMELRTALAKAGIDATKFAGHSFRIGAATTPATCGMPDSLIQTLGIWESMAYTLYIRTPPSEFCVQYQGHWRRHSEERFIGQQCISKISIHVLVAT